MLYWIYTIILAFLTGLLFMDFFREEKWQKQIALAMVLMIFVLRILQVK